MSHCPGNPLRITPLRGVYMFPGPPAPREPGITRPAEVHIAETLLPKEWIQGKFPNVPAP